jgi:hypothetical protein
MAPLDRYIPGWAAEATAPGALGPDRNRRAPSGLGRPGGAGPNARPGAVLAPAQ